VNQYHKRQPALRGLQIIIRSSSLRAKNVARSRQLQLRPIHARCLGRSVAESTRCRENVDVKASSFHKDPHTKPRNPKAFNQNQLASSNCLSFQ
jgi:hypothetical protein